MTGDLSAADPGAASQFFYVDVDNTLLRVNSLEDFALHYFSGRPGTEQPIRRLRHELAVMSAAGRDRASLNRHYYTLWSGQSVTEVAAAAEQWHDESRDRLYCRDVLNLIAQAKSESVAVVLVSASFNACLRPISQAVGAVHTVCTGLEVVDDRFTGRVTRSLVGTDKVAAVQEFAARAHPGHQWEDDIAVADHISDLNLLELVGRPIVVTGDQQLESIAAARRWQIIDTGKSPASQTPSSFEKSTMSTTRLASTPQSRSLKLAISGTYSTGKSTTTEALSILTGIPRTHALTSRELLVHLAPGKTVMELSSVELLTLGLRRFEERVHNEAVDGSFISDGSVIHEWVYGQARMQVGINPGATPLLRAIKAVAGIGRRRPYQEYMDVMGAIVKSRARTLYDAYVHLPVEFPLTSDGHRPVSEPFRRLSDDLLISALDELGLEYHIIGGTVEQRLEKIMSTFDLTTVMPVDAAIDLARRRVRAATTILEEDDRFKSAQRKKSLARRVAYAMRY